MAHDPCEAAADPSAGPTANDTVGARPAGARNDRAHVEPVGAHDVLAERAALAPFIAMDVMNTAQARAAAGDDIVHLEVGQPGTPAPAGALAKARAALDTDLLGYTGGLGRSDLREGLSAHYKRWYGLDVPPERFVITVGSSAGFVLAYIATMAAGDRIGLTVPGYPCYREIAKALDISTHLMRVGPETGWQLTPDAVRDAHAMAPLRTLMVASPANPTGTVIPPDTLRALIETCAIAGIRFISDEIYHGLTYGAPAQTALAHSDDVIVVNSFSKYFSMTGWRVGWLVVPERDVRTYERLSQHLFICAPHISQVAGLGALASLEELEDHRARYATNRACLLETLRAAGLTGFAPADGAFYLYIDVADACAALARTRGLNAGAITSLELAQAILEDVGVAVTPGLDFDPQEGGHHLRLSYAGAPERVAEGAARLAGYFQRLA